MNASIDNSEAAPKLRILFWNELFWPHVGGIERFSEELFSALGPRGFEFRVITTPLPECPAEETHRGVKVHRLPLRRGLSGSPADLKLGLEQVRKIKEEFQPHLTHLNTNGPTFLYHLLTMKIRPHPTLFTFHFEVCRENAVESLAKALNQCDRITAVSQDTLDKALKFFPEIAPKSGVIYNGLSLPSESHPGAPLNPAKFLCWGRLAANKGFDVALRAFEIISRDNPQAQMTLAGEGPEGESLKDLRKQLRLENRVAMPGRLDAAALETEIRSSVAVLMPSLEQECFGLVALEAMQRRRPVIASRYGGLAEVVGDNVTGILFKPGDEAELAKAMQHLAAHPEIAAAMGEAGIRRAREQFSLKAMADQYEAIYREMIKPASS